MYGESQIESPQGYQFGTIHVDFSAPADNHIMVPTMLVFQASVLQHLSGSEHDKQNLCRGVVAFWFWEMYDDGSSLQFTVLENRTLSCCSTKIVLTPTTYMDPTRSQPLTHRWYLWSPTRKKTNGIQMSQSNSLGLLFALKAGVSSRDRSLFVLLFLQPVLQA